MYDETYDYPKREVEDYRFAIENKERDPAVVVECLYELDDDDLEDAITFEHKVLKGKTFPRETFYGNGAAGLPS